MAREFRREDPLPSEPELLGDDEDMEIVIEDDEGHPEFIIGPDGEPIPVEEGGIAEIAAGDEDWNANLAEEIDETELTILASQLIDAFDSDKNGRADWYDTYIKGLDLVGLKIAERSLPWRDACGVFHPVLAEALIRYVSEASLELFPPTGPASVRTIGMDNAEVRKQAVRVKTELNYQLTKKMPENRPGMEMTLWRQALAGSCFRKIYKDPVLRRPTARVVPADNLVMNYTATDLLTCSRYTHDMSDTPKNDVLKMIDMGFYRYYEPEAMVSPGSEVKEKEDEIQGTSRQYDIQETVNLLEMYVDIDLPGFEHESEEKKKTGIKVPYIVTIDRDAQKILSIYRNFDEENPFIKRRVYFSHYKFLPGFGVYGVGLIHVLGGITDAATSILRQLVDAGTIANIPAGFKSRSLRIKGDDTPLRPGELRDVDLPPGMLNKSIEWIPSKEPSTVLATLLGALVDEARRLGSISDMKIGDSGGANAPVGTTLALIERHMRVVSAVQARNYASMESELDMLVDIIANEMPDEYEYPMEDGPHSRKKDFGPPIVILPVADPSGSTMSQRIIRLNAYESLASKNPQFTDMALLYRELAETMELNHADKLVPLADDFVPTDPVCENMNILQMRPVKAFINQDHESHIQVHMAAMSDPLIQQLVGQGPNANAIMAAMSAHVNEHVAYAYRAKMEAAAGISLPGPGETLPPEIEAGLSRVMAQAGQRVLQQDQATVAQQEAQAAAQDPMVQLRAEELKIQAMELQVKDFSAKAKAANDQERNAIMRDKEVLEAQIEMGHQTLARMEILVKAAQAEAALKDTKESRAVASVTDAIQTGIDAMNKNEDRDERRESTKATQKAKQGGS